MADILARTSVEASLRTGKSPESGTLLQHCWGREHPLLANIFLHYVLDEWFEKEVRPRLPGQAFVIRYADDFVIGVAREDDVRRIMDVFPKRKSKYGLTVHRRRPTWCGSEPSEADDSATAARDPSEPTAFDFLGFTH